jgi:hypothetical protein
MEKSTEKIFIQPVRRITERTRAGMRRGGLTAKARKVGIHVPDADNAAAGRKGAYASHPRNRREKVGFFDPNLPARVVGGRRGGRRCAEKIVECPHCGKITNQIQINRRHYEGRCSM